MNVCLWSRIPKTGSTSLHTRLAHYPDRMVGESPLSVQELPRVLLLTCGHYTPARLVSEGLVTENTLRRSFVFSVVRNPWARMVSLFYGIGERRWTDSFEQFVMDIRHDPGIVASREGTPLGTTTADWLTLDGTPVCELVLRMERLGDEYPALAGRFGLADKPLSVMNGHSHPPYTDVHTPATIEAVAEMEQWMIERFGYRFGEDTKGEIFGE